MLVTVNEVAERLKISTRAVQIKCKRAKLKKIGNRYQITQEIATVWYDAAAEQPVTPEPNPARTEVFQVTSRKEHQEPAKNVSFVPFVFAFLVISTIIVAVVLYFNLDDQIQEGKNIIQKTAIDHKIEVKVLNKKLNDAHDVIQNQELEIQSLKFKDSIRMFKKW